MSSLSVFAPMKKFTKVRVLKDTYFHSFRYWAGVTKVINATVRKFRYLIIGVFVFFLFA